MPLNWETALIVFAGLVAGSLAFLRPLLATGLTVIVSIGIACGASWLVWDQRTGFLTTTLKCTALSTWLVDGDQSDGWISNWHAWLAGLGYEPTVAWVAVTVDSAPEPGSTLTDYVASRVDPQAPEYARWVMAELVRHSPAAAAVLIRAEQFATR